MKKLGSQGFNFRTNMLDKIMKQIEEADVEIDFDYEQGDIVKALFENDSIEMINFQDRISHSSNNKNSLFREMRKKLRN